MNIRNILFDFLLVLSAFGQISCAHDNPPFPEVAGTRWQATNLASGILIDINFEPKAYGVTMTYYLDSVPCDVRGPVVDTVGNRWFSMNGVCIPVESETDKGEYLYGYEWMLDLVKDDGSQHYGSMYYDNRRMYLGMDGTAYPMTQVN